VPVPPEMSNFGPGVDVMGVLDIKRYDPELPSHNVKLGNMQALKVAEYPKVHNSKFDLENYQKYRSVIEHGQEVVITEKIDGTNARFTWYDGEMYAGSRNYWLKPDSVNVWNSMRTTSPEIVHFCARHPNHVLYGEIYGPVQTLKYGLDKPMFAAFAVHDGRWWMPYDEMKEVFKAYGIRKAPELCRGPWDESRMLEIAERDSIASHAPGQMMEGIVITTPQELSNRKIGRVALKYISKRFWLST
jgi:RNA ligase (TIGR02306 family)